MRRAAASLPPITELSSVLGDMVICGLKLTHDGAIALLDRGQLVFSYEMEKLANHPRHSRLSLTLLQMEETLAQAGYRLTDIDHFVIDGWADQKISTGPAEPSARPTLRLTDTEAVVVPLSCYGHIINDEDILATEEFSDPTGRLHYYSYPHICGHVFCAYCTSPFAALQADSHILVWDGGMPPQLFFYRSGSARVESLGHLFPLLGSIYTEFPHQYEPFNSEMRSFSIAGKAMAYVALGERQPMLESYFRVTLDDLIAEASSLIPTYAVFATVTAEFLRRTRAHALAQRVRANDMITSFHFFLQDLLIRTLRERLRDLPHSAVNLCFCGGCALNIKWNSALRASRLFERVWVPPFANDSGSALGAACSHMVAVENVDALRWNIYAGPRLLSAPETLLGWRRRPCSQGELAEVLHRSGEPVIYLSGRAELGPRALGHRSILATAVRAETKTLLNELKGREEYRPVAPVCLEEYAAEIFDPGVRDPYMLFEHQVRVSWRARVPAICHVDGSSRLQTVNAQQDPELYSLLTHYRRLSGIPLLCNTSANLKGCGFFPDVGSAAQWGRARYIWSDAWLYERVRV